jgi:hypothetical protein
LYSSSSVIKEGAMSRACSTNGEKRNSHRMLWESQKERKRPQGRLRCVWVDNIKVDLRQIEWGEVDWIDLTQERNYWGGGGGGTFVHYYEASSFIKCFKVLE